MKRRIIVCAFAIIITCSLFAQDDLCFDSADAKINHVQGSEFLSVASLAKNIYTGRNTDEEKIRAAYWWVVNNIQYDTDSMYVINRLHNTDSIAEATLHRRKGVCENFACLFEALLAKAGITSYTVYGYTKTGGITDWSGHCWNAVYTDDEWLLCDPTWEATSNSRSSYFLRQPEELIETHMPFDPLWQLRPFIITNREFRNGSIYNKRDKSFFNYTDSVKAYLQSDSLSRLRSAARRMLACGLDNETLYTWYLCYQMKISIIYEEKDMNLYNDAVTDYNKATGLYNDFIAYRNNMMKPAKPDNEMAAMLDGIDAIFSSAYIKIDAISFYSRQNQYNPSLLITQMEALQKKVKKQKDFLKRYLSQPETEREKLLYE